MSGCTKTCGVPGRCPAVWQILGVRSRCAAISVRQIRRVPGRYAATPVRYSFALLALTTLLSAACRSQDTEPSRPPGLLDSEGKPLVASKPPEPARRPPPPREEPASYDFERPPSAPTTAQNLGLEQPDAAGSSAPADAAAARDLSAELSSALAGVTQCVDLALAASQPNGRLVVAVSAYVLGSGRISRATIEASGQPVPALSCLQRQVLAIKLRDPVVGAPVNVRGSTEVTVKAATVRTSPTPLPPPTAPNQPAGVARGQADDMARPDQADQAGPP